MLRPAIALFALLALFAGDLIPSTADPTSHAKATGTWPQPGLWQFHIVDTDRNWLGAIVLEFTTIGTATCTEGEWKIAKLVSSSTDFFKLRGPSRKLTKGQVAVAYTIVGSTLGVDLNANLCDDNYFLAGELRNSGATGKVEHLGLPPQRKHLGWFTAAPMSGT